MACKSNVKYCDFCKVEVMNERNRKIQVIIDYKAIRHLYAGNDLAKATYKGDSDPRLHIYPCKSNLKDTIDKS